MNLKQRDDGADQADAPPSPTDSLNRLEGLRRERDELLAAGDDAIDRALSGDSQSFNVAVRQQGGQ